MQLHIWERHNLPLVDREHNGHNAWQMNGSDWKNIDEASILEVLSSTWKRLVQILGDLTINLELASGRIAQLSYKQRISEVLEKMVSDGRVIVLDLSTPHTNWFERHFSKA